MLSRRILLCLLFLCVGLTACSSDKSEQFPVKNTPEIHDDGSTTLRRGNGAEPESLDPHQARSVPAANVLRDLYAGLVQIAPDGEIVPADAESWEVGEQKLVYTFTLRDNARWSNGEPLTAQDYVYSLRRSVDPVTGSPYAQLHTPIVNANDIIQGDKPTESLGVRALDDKTLEITLKAPTPYFLGTLAHSISYPVYRPAVEAYGAAFTQPGNAVTNGAYKMASWRVNSMIGLERNSEYWDDANTAIDRVEYYPITNENSALSRYQAGELDWATKVPISQYDAIEKYIPAQLHTQPTLGVYYYGLNLRRPPFKDSPELRHAMSMAIDRRVIVDKITRGDEIPAYGWIPPVVEGYAGAKFKWATLSDTDRQAKARELYEKAGYSEDKPLKVEIRYNSGEGNKKIASVIASMWRSVLGADVTLRNEEWKVFLDSVRQGASTEAYRLAWIGDYNDPNTFFELMNSKFGLNGTGYASAEYDRLQEKQAHMPDGPERQKVMKQAEATLLGDSPVIPIYFYVSKYLIKDYVKGFEGNPLDSYYSKDLSIEP
ncbi:ABC-type oligopeptide transporter periplasmic binding protein [Salinisphaera dokdonensis CL-ES53]|uniref:ABC-type oligopeptide transporter periplasmic binding protein n=1 Tax=Salinisphaera dokdonensis CL-ES53 TaxID=1304272 RepID=A0ABV2B1Z1_9GAMM